MPLPIGIALVVVLGWITASAQVWERVALPGQFAQGYYLDVFFLPSNPQYGWACGFNGYVVRTTDGGTTWQGSIVPFNGRAGGHLESVHFVDRFTGYTSGPCGVFRSTDGGATWTDITPAFPSENPWGCYFLTATTGVVLGGGCVGAQNFFRTTDGGQTWSLFQGNQSNSGLTDALLYADGSGYAVSSGLLWQTTDGGVTWSVLVNTGPNYWNEEITRSGSSLLIPWAGSNCSGQGSGGGGRFSTDGGQSWRNFSTGVPMFGAFLHDTQRGWICGYTRQIWYTSDAGQNWQYRGCGTGGDLDDIWMITDTTGFVVGEGIYRYAKAQRTASKTALDFGPVCPPALRFDTLYVRNRSWNATNVRLSITGTGAAAYALVQPVAAPTAIPSCDSLMVVVRYQPTADGVHIATLVAAFSTGDSLTVGLRGERIGQAVTVRDTLVEVVGVPAGVITNVSVFVENRSTVTAQVSSATRIGGSTFLLQSALPLQVPPGGGTLRFSFVPPDTGWYSTRIRIRTEPCGRDTTVTLRVYAQSPIISARAAVWNTACGGATLDSVLVTNTGNSDLIISGMGIEPLGAPLNIVGTSRGGLPISVPPGESLWVRINFSGYGSGTAALVLEHNDRTLARNVSHPLRVALAYGSVRPMWQRLPAVLDFGTLCVGESRVLFVDVTNTGSIPLTIAPSVGAPFAPATGEQVQLVPTARVQVGVSFTPTAAGVWQKPLILAIEPCGLADTIQLRGQAETTLIAFDSAQVTLTLKVNQVRSVPVVVRSNGSSSARIARATLTPPDPRWRLRTPSLPLVIAPSDSITIWIDGTAGAAPTVLAGQLCVDADSLCPVQHCIEVHMTVEPIEFHRLDVIPSSIQFAEQRCQSRHDRQLVAIRNSGTFDETVTAARVEPSGAPFVIVSPALPILVQKGGTVTVEIEYAPSTEGDHSAELVLESADAWNTPQRIPLRGRFASVVTTLEPRSSDFGVLEPCSPVHTVALKFDARGMLGDTLELVVSPVSQAWQIPAAARRVEIPPNDTTGVVLQLVPGWASLDLPTVDRFVWESRVCPSQHETVVEYVVLHPRLDYAPTELRWDGAMQNVPIVGQINIHNRSAVERSVVAAELVPIVGAADVAVRTQLPLAIIPGRRAALAVEVVPRQMGDYRAVLRLIEQSVCTDTVEILLVATVVEEHYWARLSMYRHSGLVGDTITVPVMITTRDSSADALWRAEPAAIGFAVQYDPFILDAIDARAPKSRIALPVERDVGAVRVRVPREAVQSLGSTDTLAVLRFVGLQSPPLWSELHFTRSWVETFKPYTIEHDDGIVVLDACVPWMKVVLAGSVALRIEPNPSDRSNPARLIIETDRATRLRCQLFRSDGTIVTQWFVTTPTADETRIPCDAAGVYFLRITNGEGGATTVLPFIVH
ncbi:MAG: choice-of-anchor D domain-containing protein [Chlorobi bacterium]|nr:choice-of-anchor D domain-containing protein [Chlorobiota bacterium]